MIATSDYYKAHVNDRTTRWVPKVVVDYSDYNIDNTIAITIDSPNAVSIDNQIADGIKTPTFKWWNWEDFEWGMHLYDSNKQYEVGGISQQLSDHNKNFNSGVGPIYGAAFYGAAIYGGAIRKPSFTVSFSERVVNALEVVFDDKLLHYAEEFRVKIYQGTTLAHTEIVTGNTGTVWTETLSPSYEDVTSLELIIDKWSIINSPARVLEFYTSVQETYLEEDILSMSVYEESEPDKATTPIGNVTANTCDVSFINRNSTFDNDNEDSPLQNNLVKNRRIRPFVGLYGDNDSAGKQNYIELGTFYSQTWTNDNYNAIAGVNGRDIIQLMHESEYKTSQFILTPIDQTFTYTTTAEFNAFSKYNAVAENDELKFAGEPWIGSTSVEAFYGSSIYGSAIYAGFSYYGYAFNTVNFTYVAGTSVKIALAKNDTAGVGDKITYSISTDAGVTYSEIDGSFSYVPATTSASQSFILRVDFIASSISSAVSVQDITLTVSGYVSLYSLAVMVLNDFDDETGILEKKYTIDSALGDIDIPNAYLEAQSYQSALKLICEAAAARAYSTRDGYLVIKQVGGEPTYEIERDADSYFAIQNSTNPTDLYNRVTVKCNPLIKSSTRVDISELFETIAANTVKTYTLFFTVDPSEDIIYSGSTLPSGVTITGSTYYTWGANIEVTNTNGTEQSITILLEGYTYTIQGAFEVQLDDSVSIRSHGISELAIDNPLIQTETQASAITPLLIDSYKNQKRLVEVSIQTDSSLEIADGANIDNKGYKIYHQTIDYGNGLTQTIKGVKV